MSTRIIAHRACPLDAPENSLAGIQKAADLGADGVEIDVRRALDGVPVLIHDWTPRRMTGLPGPVWLYPSFLLRRLRLRMDSGTPPYSDQRVITLEEALDALPADMFLAVEVKDGFSAAATLRTIRRRRAEGRVLLWSPSDRAVAYLARAAPEIEVSLLRDDTDIDCVRRFLADAARLGARGVSVHWAVVLPEVVAEARALGLRVYSMTRDLDDVAEKAALGLDGIVTDYPREVRQILEGAAGR